MRRRHLIAALLAVLSLGFVAAPSSAQPHPVEVTDLGTLGGDATFALDINNRGQVTGTPGQRRGG